MVTVDSIVKTAYPGKVLQQCKAVKDIWNAVLHFAQIYGYETLSDSEKLYLYHGA